MHADGQRSRQQSARNDYHRRRGNARRRWRWPCRRLMMMLPGRQQRALERIEQTLVAEDPGLGLRFRVFTRLTRHEAIPGTEQATHRLQQVLRRAVILPLVLISLLALVAASGLLPSRQACPVGTHVPALGMSSENYAARCPPGPAIKLDQVHMH